MKDLPLYKGNDIVLFHNKAFKRGHALKERTKIIDEDYPYEESYKVTKSRHSKWTQATCQTQIEIPTNVGNSFEPHVSIMDIESKKCSPLTVGSCIAFVHSY